MTNVMNRFGSGGARAETKIILNRSLIFDKEKS